MQPWSLPDAWEQLEESLLPCHRPDFIENKGKSVRALHCLIRDVGIPEYEIASLSLRLDQGSGNATSSSDNQPLVLISKDSSQLGYETEDSRTIPVARFAPSRSTIRIAAATAAQPVTEVFFHLPSVLKLSSSPVSCSISIQLSHDSQLAEFGWCAPHGISAVNYTSEDFGLDLRSGSSSFDLQLGNAATFNRLLADLDASKHLQDHSGLGTSAGKLQGQSSQSLSDAERPKSSDDPVVATSRSLALHPSSSMLAISQGTDDGTRSVQSHSRRPRKSSTQAMMLLQADGKSSTPQPTSAVPSLSVASSPGNGKKTTCMVASMFLSRKQQQKRADTLDE